MAARSDPLLPLHRYRLAGQMHELAARTEGWAAGVRLSAMRMEGTEHPADFVSELALDPGSIGEYLVNEVPRDQPEPQRRLLIETSFLDEVTGSLADAIPPLLAVMRDIMLADLDTSLGRPHAALRLLRNYRGTEFAILTATARARAYLVLNDLRDAQGCIRSVLTTPSAQSGRFVLVEAMIILPFLKVKDEFAEMLARPPNVAARWPVPRPRMPAEAAAEPAAVISRDLPEPLTPRELTILRMLATSMSNSEIADELCLSVNMVKTHLAANYRKLPAGRRREAVSRARQLELI